MKQSASKWLPLLATGVVFVMCCASAQQITFERNYGWLDDEYGKSIQQTSDGGYIVAGYAGEWGNERANVTKIDSNGNTEWVQVIEYADNNTRGTAVLQDSNGDYLIGGNSENLFNPWRTYGMLAKLNATGDTLWSRLYIPDSTTQQVFANDVVEAADSAYLLLGTATGIYPDRDIYILKIDQQGDTIWTKVIGQPNYVEEGNSIQRTNDGNYIITGTFKDTLWTWGNTDVYLLKINPNGDTLWTRTYGGLGLDVGYSVQETTDGGYIIAGETWSFGSMWGAIYLIRTDSVGNALWTKYYGGESYYYTSGYSAVQCNDGGFIVTGFINEDEIDWNQNIYVMKTDANGDSLWTKTRKSVQGFQFLTDIGYSVLTTSDGGFVVAGQKYISPISGYDMYVMKMDSAGNVQPVGLHDLAHGQFGLNVYPNPVRDNGTVVLVAPTGGKVSLELHNLVGQKIRTIYEDDLIEGVKRINFNTEELVTGIYFVVMEFEGNTQTVKMVVAR